jgi:hypothetical protein
MDTRRTQTWGENVHLKPKFEEAWAMVIFFQLLQFHLCKHKEKKGSKTLKARPQTTHEGMHKNKRPCTQRHGRTWSQ